MNEPLRRFLLLSLLAYCAASLFHFSHNAEFLGNYPNMPASISRGDVYMAWIALTAAGIAGYALYQLEFQRVGLVILAVYAVFGFDGFAHYILAPMSAHTTTMNVTIWLEVATAALLLITVGTVVVSGLRHRQ